MQGTACPRCDEPVRIPDVPGSVEVRCPWCRETFPLQAALDAQPPMLEVVDEYSPVIDTPKHDFAELSVSDDRAGSGMDFSPLPFGAPLSRPTPVRRSTGSPLVSGLKIAAGGAVGCFLALLILQYLQRLPDLGFWPFRGPGTSIWSGGQREDVYSASGQRQVRGNGMSAREAANVGSITSPRQQTVASTESGSPSDAVAATEPQSTLGLEIPTFSESPPLAATEVGGLLDRAQEVLADYQSRADELDEAGKSAGPLLQSTADELRGLFIEIARAGAAKAELDAVERARLDGLVEELTRARPLLKKVVEDTRQRNEGEDAELEGPIVTFGLIAGEAGDWKLKRTREDPAPYTLAISSVGEDALRPGKVTLVIGMVQPASSITAVYARSLSGR